MVFPAAKLFTVGIRQLSKPMAQYMQRKAQNSEGFKAVCVWIASRYNSVEQRIINRFYGRSGKHAPVRKLNEAKAIELGATVFGEFVIFGTAAIALGFEYRRSVLKEAAKERELLERLYVLEAQILQLQAENDRVFQRLFPNETHARQEVDVNIDQGPGWVSWLAQPITGLFSVSHDSSGGAKTQKAAEVDSKVDTTWRASEATSSRHIPPPPELVRPVQSERLGETGSVFPSSLASAVLPNLARHTAPGEAGEKLGSHLRSAQLAQRMLKQRNAPGAVDGEESRAGQISEAPPVTYQDATAGELLNGLTKSEASTDASTSLMGTLARARSGGVDPDKVRGK
ncbi:optic atrophy 3 protein (opa3) protein [Besnoitia besnoiti]|uniref:Optic atrophy 3 protein (Opa3) protein n=1 Tax=Besnoitia besnoiti TaxID=94643 RepID=A0A2A9M9R9_BESBE|nr:optic atrophy 3 protein (opa3) protein [Besnoitia besnoiti]PFH32676.1 optic atrophy 3 protein (opa3) protein [Besnoitia besnoiti]